jgi:hypothetical protein
MERPQRQCWLRIVIPDKAIKVGGYDGALGVAMATMIASASWGLEIHWAFALFA